MDSISQIALGAAVGEAVLGKKVGYRAALWGAALGTLPDLDILANPFIDSVNELYFHRNVTHSFLFAIVSAPLFGWAINKVHSQLKVGWKKWAYLSFWVIFTHILIDIPTTYGTQALQPFTNYPITTDSIFIIDPLFTLPLLIGLLLSLCFKRTSNLRLHFNRAGLLISTLYLLWGFGIKAHVHAVFEESFLEQYGYIEKLKTTPNGPTTFLWNGYLKKNDTLYHSLYSIFDTSTDLEFREIPRNTEKIETFQNDRAIKALNWFSRGYYSAEINAEEDLIYYDLRFGRDDFWLSDDGEFVWGNKIILDDNGNAHNFDQSIPAFDARAKNLRLFWDRIWGQ